MTRSTGVHRLGGRGSHGSRHRLPQLVAAGVVALLGSTLVAGGPASPERAAAATAPVPGTVLGVGSGRCLTPTGTANLSPVVVADCTTSLAQQWTLFDNRVRNAASGRCLAVRDDATSDGSPVLLFDCNRAPGQSWTTRPNGGLVNDPSGRCLDVAKRATANNSPLQLWGCAGTAQATNQRWTATPGMPGDVLDHRAILTANDVAEPEWALANVPFLDTPDKNTNAVWYYRWSNYREHLRYTKPETGYISTEFIDANEGYAGPYGGINSAAALQLTDGRWLADQQPVLDYENYWLTGVGNPLSRAYSFWVADALWRQYQATGDSTQIRAQLPNLIRAYDGWADHFDPAVGLYAQQPLFDATEFTQSSYATCDAFGGGFGFRPTLNAYQWADATAISRIASLVGDSAVQTTFANRAKSLQDTMQAKLWDPAHDFFVQVYTKDALPYGGQQLADCNNYFGLAGTRSTWREQMGFVPWQFGMPVAADSAAWQFLPDTTRFRSAFGPTTIERWNDYEAEDPQTTAISDAVRRTDASASNGGYVGNIDDPGSAVTFTVVAPNSGGTPTLTRPVRVYFANNSGSTATQQLSVNGGPPITVSYPQSGAWGSFAGDRFVTVDVTFKQGRNTLRFGKGNGFTELDKITTNPTFGLGAENCCHWNGPSWPYQTSQTLAGMATLLDTYPAQPYVTREDFAAQLKTYVDTQFKDGHPYIAEAHSADDPVWIYDAPGHSDDYNHSTFMDNVITGLIGLRPDTGPSLSVKPLTPAAWRWFALEDVPYHGHRVSIRYDADGSHYGRGSGLQVLVDGTRVGGAATATRVSTTIPATVKPAKPTPRANWASNPDYTSGDAKVRAAAGFPKASATYQQPGEDPFLAIDGKTYYQRTIIDRWTTYGSSAPQQTLTVDFGRTRPVDEVTISLYRDPNCGAPQAQQVQYRAADGSWRNVPAPSVSPARPTANTKNTVTFARQDATGVRVVFTPTPGLCTGVTEFGAWGPA